MSRAGSEGDMSVAGPLETVWKVAMRRRTFLKLAGLAAIGTAAASSQGCNPTPVPSSQPVGALPEPPFELWKALRAALRSSPDHLPARAAELVEARDPAALHAFVRDSILTYPPTDAGWSDAVTAMRWGPRATLRGGAGTPREKAELLVDLYRRAGYKAEVVQGRIDLDEHATKILLRTLDRPFDPALDDASLAAWIDQVSDRSATPPPRLDEDAAVSDDLADTILAALPAAELAPTSWLPKGTRAVPLVRVTIDGTQRFANVIMPAVRFGDAGTADRPGSAPSADPLPDIVVRLDATLADPSLEPQSLVEGKWSLDDLAGRQLAIAFLPPEDRATLMNRRIDDIRLFRPLLALAALDLDGDTIMKRSFAGTTISVDGDLVDVAQDGSVRLNGTAASPARPADPGRVTSLRIQVDARSYPVVEVRAEPLDRRGRVVDGLAASAFRLSDGGTSRSAVLREVQPNLPANETGAGGILGTWRASDGNSMRYTFEDGRYIGRMVALSPAQRAAEFVVGQISVRVDAQPDGSWSGEQEWRWLFFGVFTGDVEWRPVRMELDGEQLRSITEGEEDSLHRRVPPYALVYDATANPGSTRTVEVAVGPTAKDTASYAIPAERAALFDRRVVGLSLTVAVGESTVTRQLAGTSDAPSLDADAREQAVAECRGAFFGAGHLSFEGAAPPLSVWLDDMLTSRLTLEPVVEAGRAGGRKALGEALGTRLPTPDPRLLLFQPPLHESAGTDSLTFELGPRAVMLWQRPGWEAAGRSSADILPTTRFATVERDPDKAFRATLRRSARLAAVEATLFDESTASLLDDRRLAFVQRDLVWALQLPDAIPEDRRMEWIDHVRAFPGCFALVPVGGEPRAFWSVDAFSGGVLGILPDGTGGTGQTESELRLDRFQRYFALLGLLDDLLGWGYGPWIELYKEIGIKVLETAIIIETGDLPPGSEPPDPIEEFAGIAGGVAEDYVGGAVPGAEDVFGAIDRANFGVEIIEGSNAETFDWTTYLRDEIPF